MTIRSGGRPRDRRQPHARRFESDAYATDYVPEAYEPSRRSGNGGNGGRRGGGGRGSGIVGIIKFLLFTLLLAAVVLVIALTALRPLVNNAILAWAADSPAALNLPFVADLVREDLGSALTEPISEDPEQVEFLVEEGDTATTIAARLAAEDLIRDPRAFVFIASDKELTGDLQQGTFVLRRNMTPDQLVTALLAPPAIPYVEIALRTGLRLEQITAKLQTLTELEMDPREFYELAKEPPAALIADYPWLERVLRDVPEGKAVARGLPVAGDATGCCRTPPPEELVRLMLDGFIANVGTAEALRAPGAWPDLLPGAVARLDRRARGGPERGATADRRRVPEPASTASPGSRTRSSTPTRRSSTRSTPWSSDKIEFEAWKGYTFWKVPEGVATDGHRGARPSCRAYQTYTQPGLIPSPIVTPTLASIDAALQPDTADKYIYFLAIPDGERRARLRQDRRGARREPEEVRLHVTMARAGGRARPTSPHPRRREREAAGRGRPGGPARAARAAPGAVRRAPGSTPTSASGASTCAT